MINIAEKIGAPPELLAMTAYYDQVIGSPITFFGALRSFSQTKGYSADYHYTEFSLEMHPGDAQEVKNLLWIIRSNINIT